MTTRTRTAKAPADQPAPAKKATGKKTPAKATAGRGTPRTRRTRTAKGTQPKLSLVKAPPPISLLKPLTARDRQFITSKQIAAYHAARTHNLPHGLIRNWTERPDGTVTRSFPSGALLAHTPDDDAPFHAFTPCANGAHHCEPVHTPNDLRTAVARAVHCHTRHYTPKGTALVDGIKTAKNTTTATQPLPLNTIAAGLAARTASADTEAAKEHPQP